MVLGVGTVDDKIVKIYVKLSNWELNIEFMSSIKVAGALVRPKGKTRHW